MIPLLQFATPAGVGAIAVIRISGPDAISLVNGVFSGKDLENQASHTIHFGNILDGDRIIDEVLVSLFIAPKSYTGENSVEIFLSRFRLYCPTNSGVTHSKRCPIGSAGRVYYEGFPQWENGLKSGRSSC